MKKKLNTDKLTTIFMLVLTYIVVALVLYVAWTGAKYLFEDIVHWGTVDTFIVFFVACRVTMKVAKLDKESGKYGKKDEVANG
jgi:succinate dehydrogenase hydrophobic anchor subunit